MKIELREISIRELVNGYYNREEDGVVGYGGKLDIRPPYQREFIYKEKQRNAVINTITEKYPLNVMYWAVREDGNYEVIDGQQRTISICQYVDGDFSTIFGDISQPRYFDNLTENETDSFLNYKLMIYLCSGTDIEKLSWFKTINISGEKLTDQELLNAIFTGAWVIDAKRYFSKIGCVAYQIGNKYLDGEVNRQKYLETVIGWISSGDIEGYMAKHQHDVNASKLWRYFQDVISWVMVTFTTYRKEMKGIEWGILYNKYKDIDYDAKEIESQISNLIEDDEVQSVKGIYQFILTGEEKYLNLRQFDDKVKRKMYEKQNGICRICNKKFQIEEMEADHIVAWHEGGKTIEVNCQMLCKLDNRTKSGK